MHRNTWHIGASLLACLLMGLVARGALAQRGGGGGGEIRIALLPVVIHSMEPRDYLQAGLADMLASRLGQHIGVGVIRVDDIQAAARSDEQARTAARAVGASWVLYGSFTQFGEGASLDLRCLRVDDDEGPIDPRSIFVQSGSLEQIIPRLGNMAERVAAHLNAGPLVHTLELPSPAAPPAAEAPTDAGAADEGSPTPVDAAEAEAVLAAPPPSPELAEEDVEPEPPAPADAAIAAPLPEPAPVDPAADAATEPPPELAEEGVE